MKTVFAHRAAILAGVVVLAGSSSAQCALEYLGRVAPQQGVLAAMNNYPRAALETPQGLFAASVDPASIAFGATGIPRFVQGRWRVDPQDTDVTPRQFALFRGRPYLAGLGGVQQFMDDRWINVANFTNQVELNSILEFQDRLLVSGNFEFINDLGETVRLIAAYDGTRWRPFTLPSGAAPFTTPPTLSLFEGELYTNIWTSAGSWHRLRSGLWETLSAPATVTSRVATLNLGESLLIAANSSSFAFDGSLFAPAAGNVPINFVEAGDRAVWGFQAFDGTATSTLVDTWFTSPEVSGGTAVGSLGGEPLYVIQGQTRLLNGSSLDLLTNPTFNVESPLAAYQGQAVGFFFDGATGLTRVLLANPISSQPLPGSFVRATTNPATITPTIAASNDALYVYNAQNGPLVIDGTPRARFVRWNGSEWISLPEPPSAGTIHAVLPEAGVLTAAIDGMLYTFQNGAWNVGIALPAQTPVARSLVRADSATLYMTLTNGSRESIRRIYRLRDGDFVPLDDGSFVPATGSHALAVVANHVYAIGNVPTSSQSIVARWTGAWQVQSGPASVAYFALLAFENNMFATASGAGVRQLIRFNLRTGTSVVATSDSLIELANAGSMILAGGRSNLFTPSVTPAFFGCPCPGDLNLDRVIDDTDFTEFAFHYDLFRCQEGSAQYNCRADLTGDGFVDDSDFVIFAQAYGTFTCP